MKSLFAFIFVPITFLTVGCASYPQSESPSTKQNANLAPEATATLAATRFWDLPYLEKAYIGSNPTDRKDAIPVGELGVDGGNKDMIVKLAQEIADNKHGKYDSVLISHKGKLLFESYYQRGRVNLPHWQGSATKPYVSLVVGRAMQLGHLTMADLDKPLVSFLKDLDRTKFVDGVEKITLHKAMTMRSGLRFSEEQMDEFRKNSSQFNGLAQIQAFLELSEPITSDSQSYKYQSPDPIMVMQVLDAVVPGSAKDFIKNELLDKVGIADYSWRSDLSGLPSADEGTSFTSRDMLKLGDMVINKGKWRGQQLISANYLAKATSKITRPIEDWQPETFSYGYFWYQSNITVGDQSYDTKIAWGGGGQRIITIEELDLIIVITGHDAEDNIFTQVSKIILPAFVKDENPVLEGRYIGQKPPGLTPEVFAPGIVSTGDRDWTGSFAPDMKRYSFGRNNAKNGKTTTVVFKSENNRWYESIEEPRVRGFISPDGKTMHSGKRYRERTDDGWSELKSLGSLFEDIRMMTLSASSKGTYVFDEIGTITPDSGAKGDGIIRYSRLIDGKREEPKPFGKEINTGTFNAHPFIAADESYIIWDSKKDGGFGDADLYVSFRQHDGSWGAAINFGDKINTDGPDSGGYVSPDGKYFFFNRKISPEDSDVYWVDAQFIEALRPKKLKLSKNHS